MGRPWGHFTVLLTTVLLTIVIMAEVVNDSFIIKLIGGEYAF